MEVGGSFAAPHLHENLNTSPPVSMTVRYGSRAEREEGGRGGDFAQPDGLSEAKRGPGERRRQASNIYPAPETYCK